MPVLFEAWYTCTCEMNCSEYHWQQRKQRELHFQLRLIEFCLLSWCRTTSQCADINRICPTIYVYFHKVCHYVFNCKSKLRSLLMVDESKQWCFEDYSNFSSKILPQAKILSPQHFFKTSRTLLLENNSFLRCINKLWPINVLLD